MKKVVFSDNALSWQKIVASRLREARNDNNLTLKEVSTKVSISDSHLSKVENGLFPIDLPLLYDLCSVYRIDPCILLQDAMGSLKLKITSLN